MLVSKGKNAQTVAIAEKPETALSIHEANPDLRIYAVLGSSNFSRAPINNNTQTALFCADNDGENSASQKKLAVSAEKIALRGIDVMQSKPTEIGYDFNDVLKQNGKKAVQHSLENAVAIAKGFKDEPFIQQLAKDSGSPKQPSAISTALEENKQIEQPAITAEQEELFINAIKKYKQYRKAAEQDPDSKPAAENLKTFSQDVTQHRKFMRYVQERFPKMADNLVSLADTKSPMHNAPKADTSTPVAITPEQEELFINAIKKYKQYKKAVEQDPDSKPAAENLKTFAQDVTQHRKFMRYVQERFPKMAKNMYQLSRGQHASQNLSYGVEI